MKNFYIYNIDKLNIKNNDHPNICFNKYITAPGYGVKFHIIHYGLNNADNWENINLDFPFRQFQKIIFNVNFIL